MSVILTFHCPSCEETFESQLAWEAHIMAEHWPSVDPPNSVREENRDE